MAQPHIQPRRRREQVLRQCVIATRQDLIPADFVAQIFIEPQQRNLTQSRALILFNVCLTDRAQIRLLLRGQPLGTDPVTHRLTYAVTRLS